jgi:hypothetical protein
MEVPFIAVQYLGVFASDLKSVQYILHVYVHIKQFNSDRAYLIQFVIIAVN